MQILTLNPSFRGTNTIMSDEEELEQSTATPFAIREAVEKNSTKTSGAFGSHSLQQWWEPDNHLNLSSRQYGYRTV